MRRRFLGFTIIRGLSLLVAVFLLFLFIRPGKEDGPPSMQRTLPQEQQAGASANAFQFAFLSDLHKGWGVFQPMIQEIAQDGNAFAVIGGDIVSKGNADRYRFFFRELSEVRGNIPMYFVPGNHDLATDNATRGLGLENFRRFCGSDHYWFSWGNAACIVLNDADAGLTIPDDEFQWLETTLRELRGRFTHLFVFMHVPPFTPRESNGDSLPEPVGKRFMRLAEKFGVAYVFSGHLHCYFREVINGVTYVGAPSAGGTPRCLHPAYGYLQIAVQGHEIKDSVIAVDNNWRLELIGDKQYELYVRSPFLLPLITVVLGQSSLYDLTLTR
jgi:Icc protein